MNIRSITTLLIISLLVIPILVVGCGDDGDDDDVGPTGGAKKVECITCEGTLNGTRWCDQGDGTVKDMTTGLVWLKNANCFGTKKWVDSSTWDDAQTASGTLKSGSCDLTDGSVEGDWRLPTKSELQSIGTDPPTTWVSDNPTATWTKPGSPFVSVQSIYYWSSNTYASSTSSAWIVDVTNGSSLGGSKDQLQQAVWPVRCD